jgi:hypothetical protein
MQSASLQVAPRVEVPSQPLHVLRKAAAARVDRTPRAPSGAGLKDTTVAEGDSASAIPRIYTLKEAAGVNRTYSLAEVAAQICGDSMKDPVLWMRRKIRGARSPHTRLDVPCG